MTNPHSADLPLIPVSDIAAVEPISEDAGREFDWLEDAGDVIVRSQPAVAVYPGPSGIVIRSRGDLWSDDGDGVVWFAVEHAPAVAAAILDAAGHISRTVAILQNITDFKKVEA